MNAYDPGNSKKTFLYGLIGVLILCMIGLLFYIVNLEDEEDPAPAPGLTAEDVREIVAENNSQLSDADIATIVAAVKSGSNVLSTEDLADILAENNEYTVEQILQIIDARSDPPKDGGGGDSGANKCNDVRQYTKAIECTDINSDPKAKEKCNEGRWVNSASKEKAVLCKWENNECVYDEDCKSDTDIGYSSDGNISDFTPDSSICGDSDNEYVNASKCSDITSGKKCGDGDGKGGRWFRINENSTKKLCKWKNNECVYHKDCGSGIEDHPGSENKYTDDDIDFCQRMINEKGVIPIGVDGEQAKTGTMTDSEKSSWTEKTCNYMYKDNAITYPPVDTPDDGGENCTNDQKILIENIELKLDNVTITSDTIPPVKQYRDWWYEKSGFMRNDFRDSLRAHLEGIKTGIPSDPCNTLTYDDIIQYYFNQIVFFNELCTDELERTTSMMDDEKNEHPETRFQNAEIDYDKINWKYKNVKKLEDLESESFKNYEPYHNGNPRSSRKVPKPYDEHFVNFRSY